MFKNYKYGAWRKEIRELLHKRLMLKNKLWTHRDKIRHHEEKIKEIKEVVLPGIEKKLNDYLKKAGN